MGHDSEGHASQGKVPLTIDTFFTKEQHTSQRTTILA